MSEPYRPLHPCVKLNLAQPEITVICRALEAYLTVLRVDSLTTKEVLRLLERLYAHEEN